MYKVAIVTSSLYDYGNEFISRYSNRSEYQIICIYNKNTKKRSKKRLVKKIIKIGILGTAVGIYLRKFYRQDFKNLKTICQEKKIELIEIENFCLGKGLTESISKIDLGISMGNGYIPSTFFNLFKEGMINIHHELLPEYPGAASIIWPIYESKNTSGFTIHRINKRIDGGKIIFKKIIPIEFYNSLGETIHYNNYKLKMESVESLHETILQLKSKNIQETENGLNRSFTTPSFLQFLKICRNFSMLKKQ